MSGQITINNLSKRITEIHIEGIIGVPEKMQFDHPQDRIATYETFRKTLAELSEVKAKTVVVNIRSTGGNVNDALLIYDTLTALQTEIITRCYGYVASAATVIAQAASKGRREISKNALYLIHQASSAAEGNSGEMVQTADLLAKTDERIAQVYAFASGKDKANFIGLMRENNGNGRWLAPEETVREGLADKIIGPGEIGNEAREMVRELNLPEIPEEFRYDSIDKSAEKNMKLRKRWNAILDFFRIGNGEDAGSEDPAERMNKAGSGRAQAIAELEERIARAENPPVDDSGQHIAHLRSRIEELEALNAKLRAKATQTQAKEDPTTGEIRRSGNAAAYENDMKNLLHV